VAVVTSGLFGTVSGSAVANVMTTGTFTIPLMKRTGYRPAFAGAVEAVASTGGQIMPPIMGAAAFVMAEFLGVSYLTVAAFALIPGAALLRRRVHGGALRGQAHGLEGPAALGRPAAAGRGAARARPPVPAAAVIIGVLLAGYSAPFAACAASLRSSRRRWLRKTTRQPSRWGDHRGAGGGRPQHRRRGAGLRLRRHRHRRRSR
jgi:TRAP-type uncharacterized transport system fused permease subunit